MSAIYIPDGYTRRKTIPAYPGNHPEADVVYRPALGRVRTEFTLTSAGGSVDRRTRFENELIAKHVVSLNGEPVTAEQADRLEVNLRLDVLNLILGFLAGETDEEAAEKKRLAWGLRLVLLHPTTAARDCGECRKWLHLDRPGSFAEKPLERGGRRIARPAAAPPPCGYCEKQPPDAPEKDRTPDTAVELDDGGWEAYRHYRECRAVNHFPDDPIVRRNAAIFQQVEELVHRAYAAHLGGGRHPGA